MRPETPREVVESQPPYILNQPYRKKNASKFKERHPDGVVCRLSAIYEIVWREFAKVHKLKCLPPPLFIDHTRKFPNYDDAEGGCLTLAAFNSGYASVLHGDYWGADESEDLCSMVLPTIYEIRVYTQAFKRDMQWHFDDKINGVVVTLQMAHVLFHELTHFHKTLNNTLTLMDNYGTKDPVSRDIVRKAQNDPSPEEMLTEEYNTEVEALRIWERWIHYEIFDDDLWTVYNGTGDNFTKGRNPLFHQALALIEYQKLDAKRLYTEFSSQKELDDCLAKMDDLRAEIIAPQHGKKLHYIITENG